MYQMFRIKTHLYSFIEAVKNTDIISFPFKPYISPVFSIFQLTNTPETTFVISPVLPVLQYFNTGTVNPVASLTDPFLVLFSQTPTAFIVSMHQMCFRHIHFISTDAPAMPVDGSLFITRVCRIKSCEAPKLPSRKIFPIGPRSVDSAPAAFTFPDFKSFVRTTFSRTRSFLLFLF